MTHNLDSLPSGAVVILGVLALIQLVLWAFAIVDLVRRPRTAVMFENKWVWLAVIVLVNLIGPVLYFAIGRTSAVEAVRQPEASPGDTLSFKGLADELYGTTDERNAP